MTADGTSAPRSGARARLALALLLLTAAFALLSPPTAPQDASLILDRSAGLLGIRPAGLAKPEYPPSSVWIAILLAAVQWVATLGQSAATRQEFVAGAASLWIDGLRLLWSFLAAAVCLEAGRLLSGTSPGANRPTGAPLTPSASGWGVVAAAAVLLLAAPGLPLATGHLLPGLPAAWLLLRLARAAAPSRSGTPGDSPFWAAVLAGILLAWFPFVWPMVLALGLVSAGRIRSGRTAFGVAAIVLFLALALVPERLQRPGDIPALFWRDWRREGGVSGSEGTGLWQFLSLSAGLGAAAWGFAAFGAAALILSAMRAGLREERARRALWVAWFGLAAWILLVLVPALSGTRRPGSVQWAAVPLVGLLCLSPGALFARSRARGDIAFLVFGVLVAVTALPARVQLHRGTRALDAMDSALEAVRARAGSGELVLAEVPRTPAWSESTGLRVFPVPRDSREPGRYDFAYWPRWYAGFQWILLSGARVRENLERSEADLPRSFYRAVERSGRLEGSWGEGGTGYRLYRIREGSEWRRPLDQAELRDIEGSPAWTWFLSQVGGLYLEAGQLRQAEMLFARGVDWDPGSAGLYNNLGSVYLRLEDFAAAARAFEAGLERSPDSFELLLNFGRACAGRGLHARAEQVLRRAAASKPEEPWVHYELGRVFLGQGKEELAILALRRHLELAPRSPRGDEVERTLEQLEARSGRAHPSF